MTGQITTTTLSDSPNGCMAYIVGPNRLQNTLLAAYIETHSRGKCSVVESISSIDLNRRDTFFSQMAVLYDCFGYHSGSFPADLQTDLEQVPPECALALFNLERCPGIEKKSLEFGARGIFYLDDTVEILLKGLTVIFGGEFWISRHNLAEVVLESSFGLRRRHVAENAYSHDLTCREVEILGMLTLGSTNEIIAAKLFISQNTVRTHLNHIFKKIKVSSRLEASNWAAKSIFGHTHEYSEK